MHWALRNGIIYSWLQFNVLCFVYFQYMMQDCHNEIMQAPQDALFTYRHFHFLSVGSAFVALGNINVPSCLSRWHFFFLCLVYLYATLCGRCAFLWWIYLHSWCLSTLSRKQRQSGPDNWIQNFFFSFFYITAWPWWALWNNTAVDYDCIKKSEERALNMIKRRIRYDYVSNLHMSVTTNKKH